MVLCCSLLRCHGTVFHTGLLCGGTVYNLSVFRVFAIQDRLSSLQNHLYSNVIQKLTSKSYVQEGKTYTKRTEVVTEVRLVDTQEAFKHLQDCLTWIQNKQVRHQYNLSSLLCLYDVNPGNSRHCYRFTKKLFRNLK